MPEETQKKFYVTTVNGRPSYEVLPDVGNVPQGYTPITAGEFQSGLQKQLAEEEANLISKPYAAGTIAPGIEALKGRLKEFSSFAPEATSAGPSGYVMVGGVPMSKASYEQQQANIAGVASGKLKEIAPGQYVPTGSPADVTPPSTLQPGQLEKPVVAGAQQTTQPAQQVPQPQATPVASVSTYTGPSLVDYLASVGKPGDFASRKMLAQSLGIQNYRGTASENTQILDTLRKGQTPQTTQAPATGTTPTTPAGTPAGGTTPTTTAPPITNMGTPAPKTPATFAETYKQALETTGVNNVKSEFDKVQESYDSLQNELNDKIGEINDNPWISEGLRSKKISSLQSKYEGKLSILTNKLKLYDSLHQQAQLEAKFLASGTQDQSQFDQNTQIKLFELAQKEAEAKAKLLEINPSQFKEVQGGLVDVGTMTWVIPPKQDGGTDKGTPLVMAITQNPKLFNELTPAEKAKVIPALQASGFDFPRELNAAQQTASQNAQSALMALSILEGNIFDKDGGLNQKALLAAASGLGGTATARREVVDVIARIRTGAALTTSEEAFYGKQVPNITDNAATAKQKIQQLTAFYAGIAGSPITIKSPEGKLYQYKDMFDANNRNEVRKALSSGYTIADY